MGLYDWQPSKTGIRKPTRALQDPFLGAMEGKVPGQQALGLPLAPMQTQGTSTTMRFPTALAAKSIQPLGGQVAPAQSAFGQRGGGGIFAGDEQRRGGVVARYGSMGEFNQAAQQAGPGMWRGQQPLPGQGTGDWEQFAEGGGLEGLRQQLYLKPEAYAALTPAVAAALQGREEAAAQEQLGEKYAEAVERLDAPGTQAPDIEAQLPTTGQVQNQIERERRRRIGEIDARLAMRQQALQEQVTRGTASQEWLTHQMGLLGRDRNAALSRLNAELADQRDQMDLQMRQMNAEALMSRYRAVAPEERMRAMAQAQLATNWPTQVTPWTNLEGYIRGARMDEATARAGMGPIVVGAGGGGGGGGGFGGPGQPPVGPAEGDTSGGFGWQSPYITTPNSGQYLGKRRRKNPIASGAMGAGLAGMMGA